MHCTVLVANRGGITVHASPYGVPSARVAEGYGRLDPFWVWDESAALEGAP